MNGFLDFQGETTYRLFITSKNIAFPTIENLISVDSSSGTRITSDILSDVWVSNYTSGFLFGVWRTAYVDYLSVS